ncbi:hypothetical protein JZ751_013477 [Albula glossodonta]|uniref:Uncharacterized protein n=1 Tax=Albula glossodonta TaxID=121402 RepID=A0A8T2MJW7_9TELE|nr:hypothetical protein JZ751_013477 [Albula glossodonta]
MLLTVLGKIRAGWAKAGSTATAVAKEVRATVSKGLAEIPSKGDVVPIAKDAVRVGGAKAMGAAMSVSTAMKEGGARVGTLVTRVQSTGEDVLPITMDAFRMGVTKGTAAVTTVATAAKGGGARLGMLMTQLQSTGEDVLPITMDAFRVGVAKGTAAVTTVATAAKGGGARLGMLMTQLLSTAVFFVMVSSGRPDDPQRAPDPDRPG